MAAIRLSDYHSDKKSRQKWGRLPAELGKLITHYHLHCLSKWNCDTTPCLAPLETAAHTALLKTQQLVVYYLYRLVKWVEQWNFQHETAEQTGIIFTGQTPTVKVKYFTHCWQFWQQTISDYFRVCSVCSPFTNYAWLYWFKSIYTWISLAIEFAHWVEFTTSNWNSIFCPFPPSRYLPSLAFSWAFHILCLFLLLGVAQVICSP